MTTSEAISYKFPFSQNMPVLLTACEEIRDLPPAAKYDLDVSEVQHCEPFGLLMLSSAIRSLRSRHAPDGTPVKVNLAGRSGKQGQSFAESMGFWWAAGEEDDKPGNLKPASDRYVRVECLSLAHLQRVEAAGADPMRSGVLSKHSANLASVLADNKGGAVWQALEYCFREMIRNAFEHSRSDKVWIAAWSRHKQAQPDVQVAILDDGDGVRKALSRRGKYSPSTDADALELALQRGVSGNIDREWSEERTANLRENFPDQNPTTWDNSGYGLYVTSELAKRAGQFAIVSGRSSLAYMGPTRVVSHTHHVGTAVRISLDPARIESAMDAVFALVGDKRASGSNAKRLISVSMMRRLGIEDHSPAKVPPQPTPGTGA